MTDSESRNFCAFYDKSKNGSFSLRCFCKDWQILVF